MPPRIYKNYYDVVILPPKEVWDYTVELGKKIRNLADTYFVIDGKEYLPHITLYHIAVADKAFNNFLIKLESIVKGHKIGDVQLNRLNSSSHNDIYIDVIKVPWLKELEKAVIDGTRELYDEEFDVVSYYNSQPGFTTPNHESFKKYKSFSYGETYKPHITLSVLKPGQGIDITEHLSLERFNFKPENIAVCRLRDFWQCREIVKQFKL